MPFTKMAEVVVGCPLTHGRNFERARKVLLMVKWCNFVENPPPSHLGEKWQEPLGPAGALGTM